jgi:hypothetical protein
MGELEIHAQQGPLALRMELCGRALRFAANSGSLYETTDGGVPSVVFGVDDLHRHGNFHPDSYRASGKTCIGPSGLKRSTLYPGDSACVLTGDGASSTAQTARMLC